MKKLTYKELKALKDDMLTVEDGCPICKRLFKDLKQRDICLDHNHVNGKIRGLLCRGCNSMEGKVHRAFVRVGLAKAGVNYEEFLIGLLCYTKFPELDVLHPTFKVKNEKKRFK
jgi:hypothetical protein